jgi:ABC-type multidrug transport system ATPase subunit
MSQQIKILRVFKSYGTARALQDVSLDIPENSLFGLIGPDGAGKTSLFRIITTLLLPDSGSVGVFGLDAVKEYRKIRRFTGYMPGRFSLYPDLTVLENLSFYATVFDTPLSEYAHLIESIYSFLRPFQHRLARNLSGGMKQKLALCCALIHNPRLLVLDEPTTGVDAVSRKEFWEALHLLKNSGMTILVSTPYMDEASQCDQVALMHNGSIISCNEPQTILNHFASYLFEVHTGDRLKALHILRSEAGVNKAYLFGQSIHVSTTLLPHNKEWVIDVLQRGGLTDATAESIRPDFEDCFIDADQAYSIPQ